MLKRGVLATLLVAAGVPMFASADSALLGTLLVVVGLALLGLPPYLRRTRA